MTSIKECKYEGWDFNYGRYKVTRRLLTDAIKAYIVPMREAEGKESSRFECNQISNYTRYVVYKKLGIDIQTGVKVNRDAFSIQQNLEIEKLERIVAGMIFILSSEGKHYTEIYAEIKKAVLKGE